MIAHVKAAIIVGVVLLVSSCATSPPTAPTAQPKAVPYSRAFAPMPNYPPAARMQRIEGMVTAWLYIEADTTVSKVVIKRSPHELLSQEAISTLSKWRINPPIKDGKPAPFVAEYDINFDLSNPDPSMGGSR